MTPPADRPAMELFARWALAHMTLAEATAFVVRMRLRDFPDEAQAARSLGVGVDEVRRWSGAGTLYAEAG
jgi:hypothetical protein